MVAILPSPVLPLRGTWVDLSAKSRQSTSLVYCVRERRPVVGIFTCQLGRRL